MSFSVMVDGAFVRVSKLMAAQGGSSFDIFVMSLG
jgi:hypothetical protein